MLLPGVTSNLTGMLVYNTTTTGGAGVNTIGIYYWNGATWVKASLPSTSAADSGRILVSNGSTWVVAPNAFGYTPGIDSARLLPTFVPITFSKVLDTLITITTTIVGNTYYYFVSPGILPSDLCWTYASSGPGLGWAWSNYTGTGVVMLVRLLGGGAPAGSAFRLRCYRPSA